jgi:diamine N-acetyltransferase
MKEGSSAQPKIKYVHGNQSLLDDIKDLWEALNLYHCNRSEHFKSHYQNMTFNKRKSDLIKKTTGGEMRVDIAVDEATAKPLGYIISSVNAEKIGEIESVYVDGPYRRMGVGGKLITTVLAWMEQKGAVEKIVEVSYGNEVAWKFYGRFGFLPRKTVLKQVEI